MTVILDDLFDIVAGEAAHLAADFDYVCESEFPAAQLAERQYRQYSEPSQQQSRKNAILAAKYVPSLKISLHFVSEKLLGRKPSSRGQVTLDGLLP